MKLPFKFTLLFFLSLTIQSFSQTPINLNKLIYLDSTWTETTDVDYKYLRIVEDYYLIKKSYLFKDYYKSETLQMIGSSLEKDVLKKDGQFVYYFENGKRKSVVIYLKGKKTGKEFNWYENGNIKSELEYLLDQEGKEYYKINNYWNLEKEQKVTDGNGNYENRNETYEESGEVKNGLHQGIWKGTDFKNKYTFIENYENGKLTAGVSTDNQNIEHKYTIVNQRPEPFKGIKSFYNYIGNSVQIPVEDRNKVFGKLFLTFIVDIEGNLVEPKIIKGLTSGIDRNALYAITQARKWKPGIIRGIPVRTLYSLPITLKGNN
jgi:antitoxin component YwqK of YwqJK toxin-antitoxin module